MMVAGSFTIEGASPSPKKTMGVVVAAVVIIVADDVETTSERQQAGRQLNSTLVNSTQRTWQRADPLRQLSPTFPHRGATITGTRYILSRLIE